MPNQTFVFDPHDIHTTGTIAKAVHGDTANTSKWLKRNAAILPAPLFTIPLTDQRTVTVWRGEDGRTIINQYMTLRNLRK